MAHPTSPEHSPLHAVWQLTGDGLPYVAWLESVAMAALNLTPPEAEKSADSPVPVDISR